MKKSLSKPKLSNNLCVPPFEIIMSFDLMPRCNNILVDGGTQKKEGGAKKKHGMSIEPGSWFVVERR